jgi:hypothetical protein
MSTCGLPAPLQFEPVVPKRLVEVINHACQFLRRIQEVTWIAALRG